MKKTIIFSLAAVVILALVFFTYLSFSRQQKNNDTADGFVDSIFPTIISIRDRLTGAGGATPINNDLLSLDDINSGSIREIIRIPSPGFIIDTGPGYKIGYFNSTSGLIEIIDLNNRSQAPILVYNSPLTGVYRLSGQLNNNLVTAIIETTNQDGLTEKKVFQDKLNSEDKKTLKFQNFNSNISLALNNDGNRLYFIETIGSKSVLSQSTSIPIAREKIIDLPLTNWQIEILDNLIALTTFPDINTGGHLYLIDPSVNRRELALANKLNLQTKISPDGSKILYSNHEENLNNLAILDQKTTTIIPLGINTFAEKCTWSSNNNIIYCAIPKSVLTKNDLSAWHRGDISFDDKFIAIDSRNGSVKEIIDPASTGNSLDAINMTYSSNLKAVIFTNKKDLHTYLLEIN